MNQKSDSRPFT